MTEITVETAADHGLSVDEYAKVLDIMGRTPNLTELGIFSVMWSEHCSYKSSKLWLKTLPTQSAKDPNRVICGPGENAGVVDIGDGQAAIFKMESHNHPSFIEPYQGAATGVGGILRDVFTMGARPIANLNALRFGEPENAKTRHLVAGVVAGIGGYGNCIGVPTVAGECEFHRRYNGNILVNAMTVGIADADKIFYSAAAGVGNAVVYLGSKTGRDGIHGATMASTEFNADADQKRPTVQVGDPFTEKLLVEACLELMDTDAIVAIQDMGAAGLTSSSFEMASKGGLGIEMNLDAVPQREDNMTPYEMMLSESQERMLMVLRPGREDLARAIFEKWELDFAVIGRLTDTGRMVLRHQGDIVADLPIDPLAKASPEYDRPWTAPSPRPAVATESVPSTDPFAALKTLLGCPDGASKRWIWEQYDHMVMTDTVAGPGGDAAVVRVHGTNKALAMTSDVTPRYVEADPFEGGKQAVAEAWRNLTAVGATPLAITDNLNFGNPEKPDIMGSFVAAVRGMGEACKALDFPVVSGNVSLYNETAGQAILPTPTIGGLGILPDLSRRVGIAVSEPGLALILIGRTKGHLGASLYLREVTRREQGTPPPVNLDWERKNGDFVRSLATDSLVSACHDLADGGLLIAAAEMALAGRAGLSLQAPPGPLPEHSWFFGEDQARYLIAVNAAEKDAVMTRAIAAGVEARIIGVSLAEPIIKIDGFGQLDIEDLRRLHEDWLPTYMAAGG